MDAFAGLPGGQSLKILRIKRKRDEEPPELLVVEHSKRGSKRRKSGIDVFQLAETVDANSWKSIQEDELRNRITSIAGLSSPKKTLDLEDMVPGDAISRKSSVTMPARQYRVIMDDFDARKSKMPTSGSGPLPPRVLSSKERSNPSSKLTIYDAILDSPRGLEEASIEMDQFQSLLKEYLTVSESNQGLSSASSIRSNMSTAVSSSDFVYDIFYYRPSTLAEQAAAADMAIVTGLPAEFDEEYELESDEEPEDEADEDSNEESYFKNDYPDEESSDEHSDDDIHYSSDDVDDSGRFEPDYD